MNLTHNLKAWQPIWSPISDVRGDIDRIFEDWLTASHSQEMKKENQFIPACSIEEATHHYLLTFDMPGVKQEDIKIETLDHQIIVSGERNYESNKVVENSKGQKYSERKFGKFQRSFSLPVGVDYEKMEAHFQDGVLSIALPKVESSKPRQIKISSGTSPSSKFFSDFDIQKEKQRSTERKLN